MKLEHMRLQFLALQTKYPARPLPVVAHNPDLDEMMAALKSPGKVPAPKRRSRKNVGNSKTTHATP